MRLTLADALLTLADLLVGASPTPSLPAAYTRAGAPVPQTGCAGERVSVRA